MKYYHVPRSGDGRDTTTTHLVAVDEDETAYDLTHANRDLESFTDLARAASVAESTLDELAAAHTAEATELSLADVESSATVPVVADEVWAAGVTYEISEEAREAESSMPDMYLDVYGADRPEVFFKATPSRTVGPGQDVGVRADSNWDVPEPELGVVLYDGDVVGYTVGNDVSSREIEGENPLYLPQAKVYDRSCALGPCISSPATVGDPHDLELSMTIERDGTVMYDEATTTANLARSVEELVSYLTRHNAVPRTCVLLTGTALVPEDEFTLRPGDEVRMHVEDVGTLVNSVREV